MELNHSLVYFALIPLLGFVLNVVAPPKRESLIYWIAIVTVSVHALLFLVFLPDWLQSGCPEVHQQGLLLYETHDTHFSLDFFFDTATAAYFFVASVLTFLVLIFSRYYIHREPGFKRFFNNVLFFYLGLSLILFAGNFETLFVGWEVIGITSFFLIGFYRDRYLPVKNALKVVSVYRVADVFLLLAIWICHHYFGQSLHFEEIGRYHITEEPYRLGIPLTFLVVALVKSAQLPFSSWLPRAMEGPTTSSAIFYGSLSVHAGVFLLLRTFPLWDDSTLFRVIVAAFGLSTSIVTTLIARVQSSVKTQIAYSSVAQIGLMFIEVALGWHTLALLHFAGNAFLRTYQLLVSPSVLSYLIHDQFFTFIPPQHNVTNTFWGKLRLSVYVLSIKEWNLDTLMYRLGWMPLKWAGRRLGFLGTPALLAVFGPLFAAGLYFAYHIEAVPGWLSAYLPLILAFVSLLLILRSFVERHEAQRGWLFVVASQLFTALAIAYNEQFDFSQIYLYLSGIVVSMLVGLLCFGVLRRAKESTSLDRFQGHSYEHPRLAAVFLLACLGLAGFPITPTFIGEDLILGHVHEQQFFLTLLISMGLILDGLAVFRIYARLFLGPHTKRYHEVAYRSS